MSDLRDKDERLGPGTYLTPEEAKEFHKLFIISFAIFTLVAIGAHFLAWNWRPWGGHYAMVDHVKSVASVTINSLLA